MLGSCFSNENSDNSDLFYKSATMKQVLTSTLP